MSVHHWGATAAEIDRDYFADTVLTGRVRLLTRAVTAYAPAALGYRWLCQVKVAPYSYDWIDNWGRPSPRFLSPDTETLRPGEDVMTIFKVIEVDPGHHYTLRGRGGAERLFGPLAITYAAEPVDDRSCRLIARLAIGADGLNRIRAEVLAWGDLVMMRRQLLNLKKYAERDALPQNQAA